MIHRQLELLLDGRLIPPAWKNFSVKPEKHLVSDAMSTSSTSSMYNIFTMPENKYAIQDSRIKDGTVESPGHKREFCFEK